MAYQPRVPKRYSICKRIARILAMITSMHDIVGYHFHDFFAFSLYQYLNASKYSEIYVNQNSSSIVSIVW